ncbi:DNA translocase FtsK [Enorma burkinafasonensis]|uniref:FtsK/SpoIIIE family DNA translocase n=1 Tax=Enorma burkinafasonensis TaxID=2590867 RepID=UPI00119E475E
MTGSTAHDIFGVALAVFAVASFIAVVAPATAPITAALAGFYHLGFGLGGYVLPLALLLVSALFFVHAEQLLKVRTVLGSLLIFLAIIAFLTLVGTPERMVLGVTVGDAELARTGGHVGFWIASVLAAGLGKAIAGVVLIGLVVAGAVIIGFSISAFTEALRERAYDLRERRLVPVNESPWGDEDALSQEEAPRAGGARRAAAPDPRQLELLDEDGEAPTTYLGDRAKTTLIADEADEPDEDPFVDLSAQIAAEQAKTTLIPVADRYVDDTADHGTEASDDEAPFEGAVLEAGRAAAPAQVPAAAEAPASAAPAIPAFLLNPRSRATDQAGGAGEGDAAAESVSAPGKTEAAEDAPAKTAEDAEEPEEGARVLPPLSMLRHNPHSASSASSEKELRQTAESLQSTLNEFGLHSRVVGWISGPTVTTFKVQPGEGERVSRISNLEDDIALSLAAQSVRIFAPIPGTSLVGIEIPNRKRQNVNLGDVLPYVQGGPLELAIGRDAEGAPIVADLAKMPHLLIAGTTGSGKSVMINSIVMALLMRSFPEDVRLIMVDPKRVELAGYNGLPHLYVPVVTEPKQAASALQWAVSEMERRLKVFERVGVRKISTFNEKQAAGAFEHYDNPPQKMPYLVIIIDELSDLMMVAGKDVEASIVRIAQLGRAAGIHLIVATQRPSSNVVTGLIKANITNRIAFNVATGIDSRVIIDQMGAEKLTGYGDMLFSKVDWGKPKRIQGCFVSDDEIAQVTEFVKAQGEADYHEEILSAVAPAMMSGGGGGAAAPQDDDPLIWEAARLVVESGLGSTSGLQRRLKVGYARAGRIMDMLEEKGVVGPPDGSKPREVLLDEDGLAELEAVEARMAADDEFGGY